MSVVGFFFFFGRLYIFKFLSKFHKFEQPLFCTVWCLPSSNTHLVQAHWLNQVSWDGTMGGKEQQNLQGIAGPGLRSTTWGVVQPCELCCCNLTHLHFFPFKCLNDLKCKLLLHLICHKCKMSHTFFKLYILPGTLFQIPRTSRYGFMSFMYFEKHHYWDWHLPII